MGNAGIKSLNYHFGCAQDLFFKFYTLMSEKILLTHFSKFMHLPLGNSVIKSCEGRNIKHHYSG